MYIFLFKFRMYRKGCFSCSLPECSGHGIPWIYAVSRGISSIIVSKCKVQFLKVICRKIDRTILLFGLKWYVFCNGNCAEFLEIG